MKTMKTPLVASLVPLAALLLHACSRSDRTDAPAAAPELLRFMATEDPGPALSVTAARQQVPGEPVLVVGRIAHVVGGVAAFTLMDQELPYCGEADSTDDCRTPWDYCCETPATRREKSLLVEVRAADGRPIATPALPDMRLLDLVKVRGRITIDQHDNQVLVADALYRATRPQLRDGLRWPK